MKKIELGDTAKDKVSGVQGVVVAITRYLTGCDRVAIQPREVKDGKPADWVNLDISQYELVENVPRIVLGDETGKTRTLKMVGGPQPDPAKW
jgi:hypothetical protein